MSLFQVTRCDKSVKVTKVKVLRYEWRHAGNFSLERVLEHHQVVILELFPVPQAVAQQYTFVVGFV